MSRSEGDMAFGFAFMLTSGWFVNLCLSIHFKPNFILSFIIFKQVNSFVSCGVMHLHHIRSDSFSR